MQALALHCHQYATSTIPLDRAYDILDQFLILFLPCGTILCTPKRFGQPANRMTECAEPWTVYGLHIIGLDLPPAQHPIEGPYEAAPPAGVRREIGILFGSRRDRDQHDVRRSNHRRQSLTHFERGPRKVFALPYSHRDFSTQQIRRKISDDPPQTFQIVSDWPAVKIGHRSEDGETGFGRGVHF